MPDARLSISEGLSGALEAGLVSGRLDIAVLYNAQPSRELDVTPLLDEDLLLVRARPPGLHEDPPPGPVACSDVAQLPLVIPTRPERDPHARRVGDGRHRLQARAWRWRSTACSAILDLVRDGAGCAILSRNALLHSPRPSAFTAQPIGEPAAAHPAVAGHQPAAAGDAGAGGDAGADRQDGAEGGPARIAPAWIACLCSAIAAFGGLSLPLRRSFGPSGRPCHPTLSSPRRRGPKAPMLGRVEESKPWIPAFAGMTPRWPVMPGSTRHPATALARRADLERRSGATLARHGTPHRPAPARHQWPACRAGVRPGARGAAHQADSLLRRSDPRSRPGHLDHVQRRQGPTGTAATARTSCVPSSQPAGA